MSESWNPTHDKADTGSDAAGGTSATGIDASASTGSSAAGGSVADTGATYVASDAASASSVISQAREILVKARHLVVFTGAGMSADSGLETYRDAQTGLWENVDPTAMASIDAWRRNPEPMWAWYLWRAHLAQSAQPNTGHRAIAEWAQQGHKVTVVTQNIDNLHERAGSQQVLHLHGSLFEFRCTQCARPETVTDFPTQPVASLTPPRCVACGGLIRPGVVWFGESLPAAQWDAAEHAMMSCDAVLIVGTSGVVQPAASLPMIAWEREIPLVEVTVQPTDLSRYTAVSVVDTAAHALPLML